MGQSDIHRHWNIVLKYKTQDSCQGIIFHRYKTGFWTHEEPIAVHKEWKQALKR